MSTIDISSLATTVRKVRRLPLPGDLLVKVGEQVVAQSVLAATQIPGQPATINLAHRLGIEPENVKRCLLKQPGDQVRIGEPLAHHKPFFGFGGETVASPMNGTIEEFNPASGMLTLRTPATKVRIYAHISGTVAEILPGEGAIIESSAVLLEGVFGVGGERIGTLQMVAETPASILSGDQILPSMDGKILVGGAMVTSDALRRAAQLGVAGIIVGAIHDDDLSEFIGYDIGLPITGQEDIPFTVILTEGFGQIPMAEQTFATLSQLHGMSASINGSTQLRAEAIRPEIIVPLP